MLPDLYLPSNPVTLLASCASALAAGHPAEIVFLEDAAPLPGEVQEALAAAFPALRVTCRSDAAAIAEFANLPGWLPRVLRRNRALAGGSLVGPADRPPSWLSGQYRHAYIYLTGHFVAKTLPPRARKIVLREEGLGSYHGLSFGWPKAVLRALTGRSPRRQMMGEEGWVDRIEIGNPDILPPALRAKARRLTFAQQMDALDPATARRLVRTFWSGEASPDGAGAALMLTQALDLAGLCSPRDMAALYGALAGALARAGYRVVLKPHPREGGRILPALPALPAFFPIEAWPWLGGRPFDLAVGLCTSALDDARAGFSRRNLQLIRPQEFRRGDFGAWRRRLAEGLDEGLAGGLAPPAPDQMS